MDSTNLDVVRRMTMGPYSVTDIKWSKVLNQIMVGGTNDKAAIYFDKRLSHKGAVECVQRQPRV